MKKVFIVLFVFVMIYTRGVGQNIGINATGATPNASAMLDVSATDKGMLVPRMTTAQRIAIASPATGLLVFDNTSISFWFYNSTAWVELTSGTTGWKITGNAGIDSATNFIGTLDNAPLRFRVNSQRAGDIDPTYRNLFLGVTAGANNQPPTSTDNTGIGSGALSQNQQGGYNTAVGSNSLNLATGGSGNTAIGYSSLAKATSGVNTAVGYLSMYSNVGGTANTAMGRIALYSNVSGNENTAMGEFAALNNTTGSFLTAIGGGALYSNQTGSSNCAIGYNTLSNNVLGSENTALGATALYYSRGFNNTAVGSASLYNTTTGFDNTALGQQSMSANQTGAYNTALGTAALQLNGVDYNTAVGFAALVNSTTGIGNTAVGDAALSANISGAYNVAIGHSAQQYNQGGSHNIAIGDFSGNNSGAPNVSNSIGIGNGDYLNGTSNQVLIGNQETLYIGGIVPWSSPSDARIKKNIKENVKGLDFIMKLRPVTYNLDHDAMNRVMGMKPDAKLASLATTAPINYSGFLAQEVEIAANQTGYDFGGLKKPQNDHDIYGLSYEQFVGPLVKGMQEQQAMIKFQQQTITDLETKLNSVLTRLTALEDKTGK